STASRKALPPARRRMNSSPRAVRRITPRCSLLEPGERSACVTVPVIFWRCGCILSAEIFGDLDDVIVVGVRDEDVDVPYALRFGLAASSARLFFVDDHEYFLLHAARLQF